VSGVVGFLTCLSLGLAVPPAQRGDPTFAETIAEISEPGGFFFSDNLVSNETSYLHVIGKLDELKVSGGAYLGVGPEQSFSYIAQIQPAVAFIIDIRRDNQLLHLLLKAIFERADTRLEYLCLLYARPCPAEPARWREVPLNQLIEYLDAAVVDSAVAAGTELALIHRAAGFGVPLTEQDQATLRRLHAEFVDQGLDLRFSAYGRRAVATFPTVRQLYLATDLRGAAVSFLASDRRYRVVRDLERADRVFPVVGDLGGPHAVKAIGRWLERRRERVSLFYLSNVEYYLLRSQTFGQFVDNVASLPRGADALLTRSYFAVQTGVPHPAQQLGHLSVQLLQPAADFLHRIRVGVPVDYLTLTTEGAIPLDPRP
jgi:hypothetical protein